MSAVGTNAEALKEASKRIQVRIRGCRLTAWVDGEPAWRTDEFGRGVWERKRGALDSPLLPPLRWRQIVDSNVRLGRAELRRRAVMSVVCGSSAGLWTTIGDLLDLENLDLMVSTGMIARKESDDGRILYNYTDRAQYSQTWNNETRLCRGLVVDETGLVLARPFPKFWNLSEHASPDLPDIPDETFTVTDKVDGSLIVAYPHHGELAVNTRGSFTSDQALAAREWLAEYSWTITKGETWLFEWIAPDNRIVVDYGQRRECVLLDVIDNATGRSIKSLSSRHPFAEAESIPETDLDSLPDRENAEGYVVRFESGMRVKVKHPRYVEIHRALNGLTDHRVWEMLRLGQGFDDLMEIVPDESYRWLDTTKSALELQFADLLTRSEHEFRDIMETIGEDGNRKGFASLALKSDLKAVLFVMLDDKPEDRVHDLIWKMIEP